MHPYIHKPVCADSVQSQSSRSSSHRGASNTRAKRVQTPGTASMLDNDLFAQSLKGVSLWLLLLLLLFSRM